MTIVVRFSVDVATAHAVRLRKCRTPDCRWRFAGARVLVRITAVDRHRRFAGTRVLVRTTAVDRHRRPRRAKRGARRRRRMFARFANGGNGPLIVVVLSQHVQTVASGDVRRRRRRRRPFVLESFLVGLRSGRVLSRRFPVHVQHRLRIVADRFVDQIPNVVAATVVNRDVRYCDLSCYRPVGTNRIYK